MALAAFLALAASAVISAWSVLSDRADFAAAERQASREATAEDPAAPAR
jgi:hypothetical protein